MKSSYVKILAVISITIICIFGSYIFREQFDDIQDNYIEQLNYNNRCTELYYKGELYSQGKINEIIKLSSDGKYIEHFILAEKMQSPVFLISNDHLYYLGGESIATSKIYEFDLQTQTERCLCKANASSMQISDDILYYITWNSPSSIISIDLLTGEESVLLSGLEISSTAFYVYRKNIFFIQNHKIYSFDIKREKIIPVTEDAVAPVWSVGNPFVIIGDSIFYWGCTSWDDFQNGNVQPSLMKVDMDNNQSMPLNVVGDENIVVTMTTDQKYIYLSLINPNTQEGKVISVQHTDSNLNVNQLLDMPVYKLQRTVDALWGTKLEDQEMVLLEAGEKAEGRLA